ncbi:MAG: methylmalonyl Co-A mutase-associated GTPase MeaB [Bdellovibrionales bacterium]|nr:methylmalonyl Co-A mutase-associated GTPase MeaB [Bdellovibrionales bacterium]
MTTFSDDELINGVVAGDTRMIARLISLAENRVERSRALLSALPKRSERAQIIGITGSPGAGKSSLVDQLSFSLANSGKRVAVVAIDPSSPFSGGAVLGDRIRMLTALSLDSVFVRSMATRGALGGISRGTHDALHILQCAPFDVIIIETVGVGQAEVDIVRSADTCAVVLVPGMGDSVQSLKAGIMEIADLFIINKSDIFGADILEKDLRVLIGLVEHSPEDWEPPIVRTIATKGEGIDETVAAFEKHHRWSSTSPRGLARNIQLTKQRLLQLFLDDMREEVEEKCQETLQRCACEVIDLQIGFPAAFERLHRAYIECATKKNS